MQQASQTGVPFTLENVKRCVCAGCPVQAKNQCVAEKKAGLEAALSRNPLEAEDIPGQYCATGVAACGDMDASQRCSCFDCPVYADYKLGDAFPTCYYCMNGEATLAGS